MLRPSSALALAGLASAVLPALAEEKELQEVVVTATRPLPGLAVPLIQVPAPVQTATGDELRTSGALDLGDFMTRKMSSVYVNEIQGNPFQVDLNYRGYTASPLLGTPQGMSVFVDGVRVNQPFGDVISWDLIPKAAIKNITLIPGSNPLFGLNTLGGALAVETKDGHSHPGFVLQATLGSFSRRSLEVEHGGANDKGLDWFVAGNFYRDNGWRTDSPSDVRQLFGKLSWRDRRTNVGISLTHANNSLNGNGLQEQRLLARDYSSVYTKPDVTDNRSLMLNLKGTHDFSDAVSFSGNMYYRRLHTSGLNADINEESLDQSVYQPSATEQAALAAAGFRGYPTSGASAANMPFPFWRCVGQALLHDEPAEKCNGRLTTSSSDQTNYGLTGQLTLVGHRNQFSVGAGYDASRIDYRQNSQLGYLNPERSVTGVNAFGDGVSGGNIDGEPYDTRVKISGKSRTWSLYASDTVSFGNRLHLTMSGRYNHTRVTTTDRIRPSGGFESLNGDNRFSRFNPAIGLTWSPVSSLIGYLGYNEGSRAPSAVELGCANPDQPCKLPNAMAGDPPLKQVVARTWEAGVRGQFSSSLRWNAGLFQARNSDDILFVAAPQTGYGYFKNFGRTQRQGMELGVSDRIGRLSISANYTYLDATFQSSETVLGSGNSSNGTVTAGTPGLDGNIQVRPGNRIPLVPRQMLKLNTDYQFTPALNLGIDMLAISGVVARGNENGQHEADGRYYLGSSVTAGYAIFSFNGRYQASRQVELLAQVNNLFDRQYATSAQLGPTGFDANGNFIARPFPAVNGEYPVQHSTFYAPGAPRQFWIGLRYAFDHPRR